MKHGLDAVRGTGELDDGYIWSGVKHLANLDPTPMKSIWIHVNGTSVLGHTWIQHQQTDPRLFGKWRSTDYFDSKRQQVYSRKSIPDRLLGRGLVDELQPSRINTRGIDVGRPPLLVRDDYPASRRPICSDYCLSPTTS